MSASYWLLWLLFTVANVALLAGTFWAWRRMCEEHDAFVASVAEHYGKDGRP